MVIDHAHAALDCQVVEAQDVWSLKAEEQKHLCRPDTDAPKRAERRYGIGVVHAFHGREVELMAVDLPCEVLDVLGLLERHAA